MSREFDLGDNRGGDPDYIEVTLFLLQRNYDAVGAAAIFEGESLTDAINRACIMYASAHRLGVGNAMSWKDGQGKTHKVVRVE